jgi:hypothetical protein
MKPLVTVFAAIFTIAISTTAQAFCGFYVAKADTSLFNSASQVVLVRDGQRTVITMANDFEGDVEDFAVVVPVPMFIERGQVNVGDKAMIDHLDAYTSPRLVEYFDPDPCIVRDRLEMMQDMSAPPSSWAERTIGARSQGITIEASYTVGEYDILILSAEESDGLIDWLNGNGYRVPSGASRVIGSYLKQGMRFFVAKVNVEEQRKAGYTYLRPLQVAYESNKFMLPIRLGTLNAKQQQDLYVYALTRTGRVETTNYRAVKLPSNVDVPAFVKSDFADFYRDMFARQAQAANDSGVFLEYAWDMSWCDPCAADPLSDRELRSLGVFWLAEESTTRKIAPPRVQDVFVTRLHVRYDREHFPEDLVFQETGDRQNYQGRYVVRHPWKGNSGCDLTTYHEQTRDRLEREAQQLANLTGWEVDEIRARIDFPSLRRMDDDPAPWWTRLWD